MIFGEGEGATDMDNYIATILDHNFSLSPLVFCQLIIVLKIKDRSLDYSYPIFWIRLQKNIYCDNRYPPLIDPIQMNQMYMYKTQYNRWCLLMCTLAHNNKDFTKNENSILLIIQNLILYSPPQNQYGLIFLSRFFSFKF